MSNVSKVLVTFFLTLVLFFTSQKLVLGGVLFTDDFDRPDSTALGNGWIEDEGDWSINGNTLLAPYTTSSDLLHNTFSIPAANYSVQVNSMSSSMENDTDLMLRYQDVNNFYLLQLVNGEAQIYKRFEGNWYLLAFSPVSTPIDTWDTWKFEVVGTTLNGYKNGVLVVSTSDSDIPFTGFAGLRGYVVNGSTIKFDNFQISDTFGDTSTPTPSPSASPIATSTPTPSPSPSSSPIPTSTPTISPSPTSTPTPVSKVIFIPGFGGSWNASAFVNCTPDPNPNNWSLASYAASVYNPVLNAMTGNGWNVHPFYYDYRAQVPNNSSVLGSVINNFAPGNEKVNIVGHSMGGLIASNFLQNSDHGTKTKGLLIAGSPLRGVPVSYPAWSGGDIWEDNFLTKVAMNLYLKRCGGLLPNRQIIQTQIPSLQNLLPVFDYLKKGNVYKTWALMNAKNNWLPIIFDSNFWGAKFETLTGTGFSTLSEIPIKDPSSKDIKSGDWLDGKPSGKTYSTNGDGTALLSSTKYDDSHNVTINQTHQGLVNSVDGMTEILRFLGTPPASNSNLIHGTNDPNSSLILIGYPGNFWITDQNGNVIKDKDGMVAFNNPKSGLYKLNLIPGSANTLFVVAQFLPNGQVFYKEYNFTNFLPKSKSLKFDINNPKEDIIN